ncbi:MAG: glycerophosphodiester phosphodiesterase [Elusimicrobia bacterium]|jgi:glycerophosphoryl diester phosphodiesterase|nr:glycerophosphodiester phosphodiesterase [Elusimicrobiota bacterium]MBK7208083.1 glycerophosphodiester phosphodiesterase [Elusimicrobiota bacterium]MBK7544860.1 glycerophosphodiester phosphodiesterase [Elusimicrobiota bacterium]MBK7574372.1 glycerophosphodiester phosphodiesterase [Elusimicrobiota bacterium]MBK7688264.1 glycerophosphodiester phosphodiesterase [Elusimicrobiota bacterium]
MILIGHRGAAGHAPENTRAAFERGLALGADALECDVHLSRDGVPVVIHDDVLDRTTDGHGFVRAMPWAALRDLDAGAWFGPAHRGERLWRLGDLLAWAKHRRTRRGRPLELVIEIKRPEDRPHPGIADKVARALRRAGWVRRSTVISFDHGAAARVKRLLPGVRVGLLFRETPPDLARRVARTRADAVFPRRHLVTPDFVAAAHARGWWVGTWTADAPAEIRRLRAAGVDALATNFPERAR